MEQQSKFDVILEWLTTVIGVPLKKIIVSKLERQIEIIKKWQESGGIGILEAVTGFGKTWVAIFIIYLITKVYPNLKIIVVVPSTKLYNDWRDNVKDFLLEGCEVFVVNTYTMEGNKWECDLLILDECHHYASYDAKVFSKVLGITKFKMLLGLSATLDDKERQFFSDYRVPVIDKVTNAEAKRNKWIADYVTYNFGLELSEEEQEEYERLNDIHNSNFGKFFFYEQSDLNWQLAMACKVGNNKLASVGERTETGASWRRWYALEMGWNGENIEHEWSPKSINKYAQQWGWAMRERKNFLYKAPSKLRIAKEIIEYLNVPTITFSENTEFADKLADSLGNRAKAYHTNLKSETEIIEKIEYRKTLDGAKRLKVKKNGVLGNKTKDGYPVTYCVEKKIGQSKIREETLRLFEQKTIDTICTAKSLDEGFNVEGIGCALIASATSKVRQQVQRVGRAVRFVVGKTAYIINLYIKDTQDEHWLRRRQAGEAGILWIDEINQIEKIC